MRVPLKLHGSREQHKPSNARLRQQAYTGWHAVACSVKLGVLGWLLCWQLSNVLSWPEHSGPYSYGHVRLAATLEHGQLRSASLRGLSKPEQ